MSPRSLSPVLPNRPTSGFAPYVSAPRKSNRFVALLLTWNARYRMRRNLAEMPDHILADIGLSRKEALAEANKPFWQG